MKSLGVVRSHTLYHLVYVMLGDSVGWAVGGLAAVAVIGEMEAGKGSGAAAKSAKSNRGSQWSVSGCPYRKGLT